MGGDLRKLIAGNWKMNGTRASLSELESLAAMLAEAAPRCDVAICPPATILSEASAIGARGGFATGGQDCHPAVSGAHTGDLSAQMLADAGARYAIVGHSERRADHGETDELVRGKAEAALAAGLVPIVCVGETEVERRAGRAIEVSAGQLAASLPEDAATRDVVVAYEPVWAIGTGLTPTIADIEEMHGALRERLVARFGERGRAIPILYGGSLKPGNARDILAVPNVDGGLVGGASLLAKDLFAIISAS